MNLHSAFDGCIDTQDSTHFTIPPGKNTSSLAEHQSVAPISLHSNNAAIHITAGNNDLLKPVKRRRRRLKPVPSPEILAMKRKAFLQRNRDAASKCRAKQKTRAQELENTGKKLEAINRTLKNEMSTILLEVLVLREEIEELQCGQDCESCGKHVLMSKRLQPSQVVRRL